MDKKNGFAIALSSILCFVGCFGPLGLKPQPVNHSQRLASFPCANLPLQKQATIYWNDPLIPFIVAENDSDCAFILGMVHAHLRLGQMTLMRRASQGRLAESAGPLAAGIDHSLRILNLGQAVDSIKQMLPYETKAWMCSFIDGLNFYQKQMKEKPVEFEMMNIVPEPWRIEDLLTIGRLMSADVNWFNWFAWLPLQDKPYFPELWGRFVSLGYASTPSFASDHSFMAGLMPAAWKSGSNALVVSAARSADSSALLASDPHLGLQLPNLWLVAGYRCPSYQVVGLMFPGVPMVLVGRNPHIAWAGTNMRAASSDVYELSPQQSAGISRRKEKIKVRWWPDKEITIRTSPYGPILSDSPLLKGKKDQTLALKWLGHTASDELTAFLAANKAQNWQQFQRAFVSYGISGQNFVYADTAGHIGMVLAVRAPKRNKHYIPKPAQDPADTNALWDGTWRSDELPNIFDPASGFLASANNRPVVTEPPVGYFFSANDRIQRLQELLAADSRLTMTDMADLQRDVYVASAVLLRDSLFSKITTRIESLPEKTSDILNTLRQWDGHYRADSRGPVALQLLLYHLITGYYTRKYDKQVATMLRSSEQANLFLLQDLAEDDSEGLHAILRHALIRAAKDFEKIPDWGSMHRLRLSHPFGNIPVIGSRFQFGDYPANGSYNTLMKTAHAIDNKRHNTFYGANSRFITRVKNPDDNYLVLLGGQDGWIGSPHLVDQVELWRGGRYLKVPMTLDSVKAYFSTKMNLQPGGQSKNGSE